MGVASLSAVDLLIEIIRENSPRSKWTDAPLEEFRRVANTNRGEIGEQFIRRYLAQAGIKTGNGSRVTRTDLVIRGKRIEVKTASEDVGGHYQFNHVRMDRQYHYLMCLGVSPAHIMFNAWRKGSVSEGEAGVLVRMAEGQSVTFKLTKRQDAMRPIEELPLWVQSEIFS